MLACRLPLFLGRMDQSGRGRWASRVCVIREHVACSPCYHAKCPLDLRCQNEVTVEMVVEGLEQAILMR